MKKKQIVVETVFSNLLGYKIIRLDLKSLNLTRFSKEKEVRKCIKKLVLPKLNR